MRDLFPRRLGETTSLCPVCLRRIDASLVARGEEVFLEKSCPGHGWWSTPIWRGEPAYEAWTRPRTPARPERCATEKRAGCPFDCGLCPDHRQRPCSVLLEVTGQCDLSCAVCFADAPKAGPLSADPDLECVARWYERVMEGAGPCNIQLSGGEPTLRDDLARIVGLGREKGFFFIQVNTNGLRLARDPDYAEGLRNAGLSTVFLQFDGTEDAIHRALRTRPLMREKAAAIDVCGEKGLGVVLVPTLVPGINTDNIGSIIRFALSRAPVVRGVHFQPLSRFGRYAFPHAVSGRITLPEVMRALEEQTDHLVERGDFLPPGTENSHCSFHGSFVVMAGNRLRRTSPSLQGCCAGRDQGQGLSRTIATMARQWSAAPTGVGRSAQGPSAGEGAARGAPSGQGCAAVIDLDAFLDRATHYGFSISSMAFQDVWSLDMERLRDCCISVVSPGGRLIPFCAYQLTGQRGEALYRGRP